MRKPRIKIAHSPVNYGQKRGDEPGVNHIRIGGIAPGIRRDLVDRGGWMWGLLVLLDGSQTVSEVVAAMAVAFPAIPGTMVRAAIDDLIQAGHVEDADEPESKLDEATRTRFSRDRAFNQCVDPVPRRSGWEAQTLLGEASVAIIGLGGVGCMAAQALVRSGVGHVHCVDRDRVGLSDLDRQILYFDKDIGAVKVDVAVPRLRLHNPAVQVTGERLDIDSPDILHDLASNVDVLVLAADEPSEIRTWANRTSLATGTPWVHGGYHGPLISVGVYRPRAGPCYDCGIAEELARLARLPARTEWPPARYLPHVHAANAGSVGFAGSRVMLAVLSLITGVPALETNREYGFNLVTSNSYSFLPLAAPSRRCPSCGGMG